MVINMKAVIQRVLSASVETGGKIIGGIGKGFLVLLGVAEGDSESEACLLAAKTAKLRVFSDSENKMNLSVLDVEGEILCVSQFTLCADLKKGNRPSFTPGAKPETAETLYEKYMFFLEREGVKNVEHGKFGAEMKVNLVNDGPVTILLDTDLWRGR